MRLVLPFLLTIIALTAIADTFPEASLDSLKWEKRIVLLFGDDEESPEIVKMRDALAEREDEVEDRDIVVFVVPLDEERGRTLAERWGIELGRFTYLLIGKDGTEKDRSNDVVEPDEIFALIDTMPMRRQEMKRSETE